MADNATTLDGLQYELADARKNLKDIEDVIAGLSPDVKEDVTATVKKVADIVRRHSIGGAIGVAYMGAQMLVAQIEHELNSLVRDEAKKKPS